MNTHSDDDILERSVEAMRQAPIPDGPDGKVVADTLAAMRLAAQKSNSFSRFLTMRNVSRMAAGLVLAAGLALLMFVMLRAPSASFADVIKKVRDAKYLSFVTMASVPNQKEPMRTDVLVSSDGKMRAQTQDGSLVITDIAAHQVVSIQPRSKLAIVIRIQDVQEMGQVDLISAFKNLGEHPQRELGEKEIDGRPARGFAASVANQEFEIWADKKSGDPIRMQITVPMGGQNVAVTYSDFNVNPQVPEKAFDQTIPEGYTVQRLDAPKPGGEESAIELLRGYAQRNNGAFPAKIDDWAAYAKLMKPGAGGVLSEQDMKWMIHMGAMQGFLFTQKKDDWGYAGKGHKLGDKDAVIFWFKKSGGAGEGVQSDRYRAVFGDLTAQDVKKEAFPK